MQKTAEFISLSFGEIRALLQNVFKTNMRYFVIPRSNVEALKDFFSASNSGTLGSISYKPGEVIVERGRISHGVLRRDPEYSYAFVPLGFIQSGDVSVFKNGKATKNLSDGDFIGLFETSDWLLTKATREIGDWTLVANADTRILFFDKSTLLLHTDAAESLRLYLTELARGDQVPQPISSMPLLDWIASHTTKQRLPNTAILAHTHILPNNLPFFRHLAHLVGPGKIFIIEKPYSTVRSARDYLIRSGCEVIDVHMEPGMPYEFSVEKSLRGLWPMVLEVRGRGQFSNLLLVDDGGDLWRSIPWEHLSGISIAGVEQTQRGITRITQGRIRIPPIISVPSSPIKKHIEAYFIGRAVVQKLFGHPVYSPNLRFGVLGMGSIGAAVSEALHEKGLQPKFYDPGWKVPDTQFCHSIDTLLNQSDIVIGTTGTDGLKGIAFERVSGEKILVSATSADVEWLSVLKMADSTSSPFGTRCVTVHDGLTFKILNGGYPLNFDRVSDATESEDIALTRGLMYIGAMQAAMLLQKNNQVGHVYDVDPVAQRALLTRWIEDKTNAHQTLPPNVATVLEQVTNLPRPPGLPIVWH